MKWMNETTTFPINARTFQQGQLSTQAAALQEAQEELAAAQEEAAVRVFIVFFGGEVGRGGHASSLSHTPQHTTI